MKCWKPAALQGHARGAALSDLFAIDERGMKIEPDLYPIPDLEPWPTTPEGAGRLGGRPESGRPEALPEDWDACVRAGEIASKP